MCVVLCSHTCRMVSPSAERPLQSWQKPSHLHRTPLNLWPQYFLETISLWRVLVHGCWGHPEKTQRPTNKHRCLHISPAEKLLCLARFSYMVFICFIQVTCELPINPISHLVLYFSIYKQSHMHPQISVKPNLSLLLSIWYTTYILCTQTHHRVYEHDWTQSV